MLRKIVEARAVVALAMSGGVGLWGLRAYPISHDDVFLGLIGERAPGVLSVLTYGYATLWFTTPYFAASLLMSLMAIVVYRRAPRARVRPLPPYPQPEQRPTPSLVLGERHYATTPGPAARPEWLTVPQRGLYTGVMILGAVGTGKTSACMYPYVDQLLRWKADDPARKLGGLVLEVKGDFCGQVRSMLHRTGRDADYVEVGLDTGVCYNPLHNELDPYAVAYAVATLLNNLFGRSKEPFWQQAYTDLLKFVILLRRISDGYTTFSEVYRYILDDQQIARDIRRLKADLSEPPDVLVIRQVDFREHCVQKPWAHWFDEDDELADRVLDLMAQHPAWHLPLGYKDGVFGAERVPSGAYLGDRDMFLFLVDGNRSLDDPTDGSQAGLFRGFMLRNSDVGAAALSLDMFLFRAVCSNHIIWGFHHVAGFRRRHIGASIHHAWTHSLRGVRAALDADLATDRTILLRATSQELGATREKVIDAVVQRLDLPRKHALDAYTMAEQHETNPRSVWGYVQGLTRLSQHTPWQDTRYTLDRAASRLLATVH